MIERYEQIQSNYYTFGVQVNVQVVTVLLSQIRLDTSVPKVAVHKLVCQRVLTRLTLGHNHLCLQRHTVQPRSIRFHCADLTRRYTGPLQCVPMSIFLSNFHELPAWSQPGGYPYLVRTPNLLSTDLPNNYNEGCVGADNSPYLLSNYDGCPFCPYCAPCKRPSYPASTSAPRNI